MDVQDSAKMYAKIGFSINNSLEYVLGIKTVKIVRQMGMNMLEAMKFQI